MSRTRGRVTVLCGAICLVIVLVMLPFVVARYGAPAGFVFRGTLKPSGDESQYLAAVRMGRMGEWLWHDPYMAQPPGPILMYPVYLGAGHLAAMAHLDTASGFAALHALAALILCWALWRLAVLALPAGDRPWFLVFGLGAGGLYWLVALLATADRAPVELSRMGSQGLSGFTATLMEAHEALGVAGQILAIAGMLGALRGVGGEGRSSFFDFRSNRKWACLPQLIGGVGGMLLVGLSMPVLLPLTLLVLAIASGLWLLRGPNHTHLRRVPAVLGWQGFHAPEGASTPARAVAQPTTVGRVPGTGYPLGAVRCASMRPQSIGVGRMGPPAPGGRSRQRERTEVHAWRPWAPVGDTPRNACRGFSGGCPGSRTSAHSYGPQSQAAYLRILCLAVIGLPGAILALYYARLFGSGPWAEGQFRVVSAIPPLEQALLWGSLLPFAAWGWRRAAPAARPVANALAIWASCALIGAQLPFWQGSRLTAGMAVVCGALFALGLLGVNAGRPARVRWLAVLALGPLCQYLFLLTTLAGGNAPHLYNSAAEDRAAHWLAANARGGDIVLAPFGFANVLPTIAPLRVVAGHTYQTLDLPLRVDQVHTFYGATEPRATRLRALRASGATLVVYDRLDTEDGPFDPRSLPNLRMVFASGAVTVFRVG